MAGEEINTAQNHDYTSIFTKVIDEPNGEKTSFSDVIDDIILAGADNGKIEQTAIDNLVNLFNESYLAKLKVDNDSFDLANTDQCIEVVLRNIELNRLHAGIIRLRDNSTQWKQLYDALITKNPEFTAISADLQKNLTAAQVKIKDSGYAKDGINFGIIDQKSEMVGNIDAIKRLSANQDHGIKMIGLLNKLENDPDMQVALLGSLLLSNPKEVGALLDAMTDKNGNMLGIEHASDSLGWKGYANIAGRSLVMLAVAALTIFVALYAPALLGFDITSLGGVTFGFFTVWTSVMALKPYMSDDLTKDQFGEKIASMKTHADNVKSIPDPVVKGVFPVRAYGNYIVSGMHEEKKAIRGGIVGDSKMNEVLLKVEDVVKNNKEYVEKHHVNVENGVSKLMNEMVGNVKNIGKTIAKSNEMSPSQPNMHHALDLKLHKALNIGGKNRLGM